MRALVLADTHLKTDLSPLPPAVWHAVEDADVVLHAGDVVTGDLLGALRRVRPVHAVLGNNDRALVGALPTAWPSRSAACGWRWSTTRVPVPAGNAA